ncbi:MarR family winged helix-turn-helix transcriptional regulator [Spirillospora sp. CA-255316]
MDPEQPRWLNEEERQTWLSLVGVMVRLPVALDSQLQRDAGVGHFEYLAMAVLSEAPERTLRMRELAMVTNGSLSRLSHLIKRLEKKGWVQRTPDPDDPRYNFAVLTEAGWDKVVATAPGHVEEVRRLVFDPLTKAQQRQLATISRRIGHAIDPDDTGPH